MSTATAGGLLSGGFRSKVASYLPSNVFLDGQNPWDLQVRDDRFYKAVVAHGTLGLGEAYMQGWWDVKDHAALDVFFEHMFNAGMLERFSSHPTTLAYRAREMLFNTQNRSRSKEVIDAHYDPGSDIILSFLDPYNQYTCGYWEDCNDLDTAQQKKLDLICRKLELKSYDRVLDVGCGWYGFAKYAAEKYGCHVTGITIAKAQIAYGEEFCKGLPVTIKYCDYRDLDGTYDKILICGMGEHVGYKNYGVLAESISRCLAPDGLFLWHTIGKGRESIRAEEPWIMKYIFPNGMIPTVARIAKATQPHFDIVHTQEFGAYYEPTLMAWRDRLVANWHKVSGAHTDRDYRMWYYYLSSCAALFRTRKLNLWQFVFRKAGGPAYTWVR